MTRRDLERQLAAQGFAHIRRSQDAHEIYKHADGRLVVIARKHGQRTIPNEKLHAIRRQMSRPIQKG